MALNKIINDFIESIDFTRGTAGSITLENGLIIKWHGGVLKTSTTSPMQIDFPEPFPTSTLAVLVSFSGQVNPNGSAVSAGQVTKTGFNAYTTSGAPGLFITYIAIGY